MRPRPPHPPLALAAFAATSALLLLGPPACDEGADAPGGKRVALATRATSDGEASAPFTTATGWTVTLTRAQVSLGALYYFDGEPVLTARLAPPAAPPGARWAWPFGLRTAHAHPGHYVPGNALGQMVVPSRFDLSAGDAALPTGDGVTGPFRSAKVVFAAPAEGGAAIALAGRAEKGAEVRAFSAEFSADELRADETQLESAVEGCAFEPADVEGDGFVTLAARPSIWFEQTDFAELAPSADGAPQPLPADSAARRALSRGLKKGAAYVFRYATQ
ncbi:MAG TPA: hypothetical protein VFS43_13000 [Polyangiaceae bacterium]|nr:hypothetical protein [Polyangiaceae bacterium]